MKFLEQPIEQVNGRLEGLLLGRLQRPLRQRIHERIATAIGMRGKDADVLNELLLDIQLGVPLVLIKTIPLDS